jgi:hypothetical protein
MIRGPRPPKGSWICYSEHIYQKVGHVQNFAVEYHFLETREIVRCKVYLARLRRRCLLSAEPTTEYCRTHRNHAGRPGSAMIDE